MKSHTETRQLPGPACEECRRRRSRCDRVRPKCGLCTEIGRNCVIMNKRSQRGPKKGQLEELRSRVGNPRQVIQPTLELKLVSQQGLDSVLPSTESIESVFKGDPVADSGPYESSETTENEEVMAALEFDWGSSYQEIESQTLIGSPAYWHGTFDFVSPPSFPERQKLPDHTPPTFTLGSTIQNSILCDGGVEISDLTRVELDLLYFERVHPIAPIIHKKCYFAWAADPQPTPARACLRFAMWTVTTAMSAQFCALGDALYATTRRLLETQEVHNEAGLPWMTKTSTCTSVKIKHELVQAWLLLVHYEFLRKPESQATLTFQRAFRLLQLSNMFDIDLLDDRAQAKSTYAAPPPSERLPGSEDDWITTEGKRRTLWVAFILDRLSSMLNGRQFLLHEEMVSMQSIRIRTRLPMPEAEYQTGREPVVMCFLSDTMLNETGDNTLSNMAECVVLANIFGRCLTHERLAHTMPLLGSGSDSRAFWARHNWLAAAVERARQRSATGCSNSPVVVANTQTSPNDHGGRSKCDPMRALNQSLAPTAAVALSRTAGAINWERPDYQSMTASYKALATQAACEVVTLMKHAPRIAFLKVCWSQRSGRHPLAHGVIK
ncbi:fungal-specific transcription factor domain protein [Apiospora hydei]|uniref:Fungal-specific transcription factor domain protein n=1 Tax=Apiospora hydei TaxID=1337664 RepID=A0ABR1VW36_9PEZI